MNHVTPLMMNCLFRTETYVALKNYRATKKKKKKEKKRKKKEKNTIVLEHQVSKYQKLRDPTDVMFSSPWARTSPAQ
jgi:hypothetical protein